MKLVEGQEIQFQSFNQKFNYIKELGSGGTGRTILVKDKLTNVLFAIKKFTPISKEYQEDLYRRFIDEIITLNNIAHNNIVRIYTYYIYEESKLGYIQMEYIEGFDIDDAFNFSSIGLEDENLPDKMFEQAISAFCYLENKKILHRDIRASNLLVDKSSNLKLIDFGFGKMLEPSKDIAESIILNWPATQMPEEIISSESSFYDKTTEIYFLGALFKQLLNSYDTVSFSYNSIINRMAKIRRKERYQNFTEIQNELSGKIFKNAFSSQEKDVYREFAQYLSDILIELNSEYVINYEVADVIRLCNELYEDNILEANIQNNNLLVRCFITEGAFMYDRSVHVPMEVYINFLKLLNDAPEFKQRLIINNIANRIRKTRIKTIEDDLPF